MALAYIEDTSTGYLTLTVHISIQIKLSYVVWRGRLNPDTLPDSTTGSVENVTGMERLFSNWDHNTVTISRIVHKNEPIDISDALAATDFV